ncbi:MAG: hypothetical protein ACYC0V_13575 [Armatimonadota bacterium]
MKKSWLQNIANAITGAEPEYVPDEAQSSTPPYVWKPGTCAGETCINPKDGAAHCGFRKANSQWAAPTKTLRHWLN